MKMPIQKVLTLEAIPGFAERSITMENETSTNENGNETGSETESSTTNENGDPPKPVMPKPIPTGPRPDGTTDSQIYVLLVGINNYPEGITDLRGCIKDLDQIEQYLNGREDAEHIHILRLEDKNATYNNILDGFQSHLNKAQANDIAWFHFSGHGSEELTAEEFLPFAPNGKDQTMVTYWESDADGHRHIADKEMAALIKDLATIDEMRNQKLGSPSIVISQDCCHSGGGTRDMANMILSRMHPLSGDKRRAITSYYGGYDKQSNINVPIAPHIALAACESVQVAGDMQQGGVFTTNLVTTLKQASEVNYTDLFTRTRAQVKRIGAEQTPQFETIGGFNPYTKFLGDESIGSQLLYDLEAKEKPNPLNPLRKQIEWVVKCGAIHGLPAQAEQPILIAVQNQAEEEIGKAKLTRIGAQQSSFQFVKLAPESNNWQDDNSVSLDPEQNYQAVLLSLPAAPVLVWIEGSESEKENLIADWHASDKTSARNILLAEDKASASFAINAIGTNYQLVDLKSDKILKTIAKTDDNPEEFIIFDLGKVVNWERSLQLSNPHSKIKAWLDFRLELVDHKPDALILREKDLSAELENAEKPLSISEFLKISEHKIELDPQKFFVGNGKVGSRMKPVLTFNGVEQDLYCYLLHFQDDYAIIAHEGEIVFRPGEHEDTAKVEQVMWSNTHRAVGLGLEKPQAMTILKLLVTTEQLNYKQLVQGGLEGDRNVFIFEDDNKISDDWCCFTITMDLAIPKALLSQS
ncbi:MAG: caspase family protein [Bacteroidota bacterium]